MKYFYILIILLFVTSLVFAGELNATARDSNVKPIADITPTTDNLKVYDVRTATATISDKTGKNEYAAIKLLTPTNNKVGLGYQKVAEFEVNSKVTYINFLRGMYFYDTKKGMSPISRKYDLRFEVPYAVEEPVYETTCGSEKDINGNILCSERQSGTKIINKVRYDAYTDIDFPAITIYKISLWTDITKPESVEWIPDLFGTTITEWASWTADLNVGLISYWKLDETTGTTAYDSNTISANNGTNINSVPINNIGKIGSAYGSFTPDKLVFFGTNNTDLVLGSNTPYSICVWVYPLSLPGVGNATMVYVQEKGTNNYAEWGFDIGFGGTNKIDFFMNKSGVCGTDATAETAMSAGNWYFVCGTYSGTGTDTNGMKLYINGVHQNTDKTFCGGAGIHAPEGDARIGAGLGYPSFDGNVDELAIWGKVLSASDINYLYNGGAGMTIGATDPIINSIIINKGANLDGVNYDLNANISNATSVTYKCYSGTGDGSGCTSGSWDCKTGNLTNSSATNWSTSVTGTTKDTNGTWTCKITAGTTSDSNTATMNEITGIIIDSSSGTYAGNPGTNNNPISTNQSKAYAVITHNGNVNLNLNAVGENFVFGANNILLENQKWYLTNDSGLSVPFTGSTDTIKTGFTKGTYPTSALQNVYLWLNIPASKLSGAYQSTLTFGSEKA